MNYTKMTKKVKGKGLFDITEEIQNCLNTLILKNSKTSGILHIVNLHTSSALTINEAWDPSARQDLESFLNYIAPENLPFIQHTLEGPDDSPAHMKTALLNQHLALIVEDKKIVLGQWQGIFLAEFRDQPRERTLLCKFQPDF